MASYQDPRKTPKTEPRRVTERPAPKAAKGKQPEPKAKPKPVYRDWAMF